VTGSTATGYRPAIVDQIHTYDLASNRLSKRDGRAGASWAGRDWEYSYDALGRLTEARKGGFFGRGSASHLTMRSTGGTNRPGGRQVPLPRSAIGASGHYLVERRHVGRETRRERRGLRPQRMDEWTRSNLVNLRRT
jgi:hypothetical protein